MWSAEKLHANAYSDEMIGLIPVGAIVVDKVFTFTQRKKYGSLSSSTRLDWSNKIGIILKS